MLDTRYERRRPSLVILHRCPPPPCDDAEDAQQDSEDDEPGEQAASASELERGATARLPAPTACGRAQRSHPARLRTARGRRAGERDQANFLVGQSEVAAVARADHTLIGEHCGRARRAKPNLSCATRVSGARRRAAAFSRLATSVRRSQCRRLARGPRTPSCRRRRTRRRQRRRPRPVVHSLCRRCCSTSLSPCCEQRDGRPRLIRTGW